VRTSRMLFAASAGAAALLSAGGCVSSQQYSKVCQERDALASTLARTQMARDAADHENGQLALAVDDAQVGYDEVLNRAERSEAKLSNTSAALDQTKNDLDATRQQLTVAERSLSDTRATLTTTQGRVAQLTRQADGLTAELAKSHEDAKAQATQAAEQLDRTRVAAAEAATKDEAELRAVRDELTQAKLVRADAEKQLGVARRTGTELSGRIEKLSADLNKAQADDHAHAASLAQAQADLAGARKEVTELRTVRQRLTEAEQAGADARSKLTTAQKRVVELEAKVGTLTAQVKQAAATPKEPDAATATTAAATSAPD